jgi:hypothetical protein
MGIASLMDLCVVSGGNVMKYQSYVNHKVYASRHGYDYRMEYGPYPNLPSPFFIKLAATTHILHRYDWVFWIDDDAFFTNFDIPLTNFIQGLDESDTFFVACKSPVNLEGGWTWMSSGQFFMRNCPDSFAYIEKVMQVDMEVVKAWWDEKLYGMYTYGDQDSMVYTLVNSDFGRKALRLDYNAFNNRWYHYHNSFSEHFLCHFTGIDKPGMIRSFADRFNLDETLFPAALLADPKSGYRQG